MARKSADVDFFKKKIRSQLLSEAWI